MRFLANENIPAAVVIALRDGGHDVVSVKESMRGADDRVVLARAQTEQRVVLTCDPARLLRLSLKYDRLGQAVHQTRLSTHLIEFHFECHRGRKNHSSIANGRNRRLIVEG
jgi:hypothetical protein